MIELASEEKLTKIKQLCKGYGSVVLQFDSIKQVWQLTSPIIIKEDTKSWFSAKDPADCIDGYWEIITNQPILLECEGKVTRYFTWDKNNNLWLEQFAATPD
jgi:hypothetical protein